MSAFDGFRGCNPTVQQSQLGPFTNSAMPSVNLAWQFLASGKWCSGRHEGLKNLGRTKSVFWSYVTLQEKHISPWGNGKLHLQKVATGRGGLLVPRMIYCRIISFYLNLTSEGISTILQTCIVQQGFIVCQPPISGPIAGHLEWGDPAMTPPPYPRTIINLANT